MKTEELTCVFCASIWERQQGSIQGALCVLQDGVVLVDVLHHLGVELILLSTKIKNCEDWDVNNSTAQNNILCFLMFARVSLRGVSECTADCVCLSGVIEVDLNSVTIPLWQLSKQREGHTMTWQPHRHDWHVIFYRLKSKGLLRACVLVFHCLCGWLHSSSTVGLRASALQHLLLISNVSTPLALSWLCNSSNSCHPVL